MKTVFLQMGILYITCMLIKIVDNYLAESCSNPGYQLFKCPQFMLRYRHILTA